MACRKNPKLLVYGSPSSPQSVPDPPSHCSAARTWPPATRCFTSSLKHSGFPSTIPHLVHHKARRTHCPLRSSFTCANRNLDNTREQTQHCGEKVGLLGTGIQEKIRNLLPGEKEVLSDIARRESDGLTPIRWQLTTPCQNYRCKYPLRQQCCLWKSILQIPLHAYKWQMYKIIHWGIHCNGKRLEPSQVAPDRGVVNVLWHPHRGL